ncbi:MAG TPA: hypothetical protein VIA18_30280 [Polyangia bacterium]|nr:hypothetical protein [Polyangia bacterium]
MSAKKTCVSCGKQIPSVALVCVFCSAAQPEASASTADAPDAATAADAAPAVEVAASSNSGRHHTDPTLLGIRAEDVRAMAAAQTAEAAAANGPATNGTPAAVRPTAAMAAVVAEPDAAVDVASADAGAGQTITVDEDTPATAIDSEPSQPTIDAAPLPIPRRSPVYVGEPWAGLGRIIMGIGGAVLVALFFCPWHGVSSWQLLETLAGADFVRQLFYLTGGIVLLATAVLPLPFLFRASVGTFVAALPVLLGAHGVLDGWRGVVAALAVLGLPATHLLRSRARASSLARLLVLAAVAAVVLLYLAPMSSVVPIVFVFKMICSGSLGYAVLGLFVLIPLLFAGLSLLGVLGRDLTEIGVLLSVLILLWAPVTVALRGMMIDDGTQLYVALALLWASATAALSLAQLLSVAAARAQSS